MCQSGNQTTKKECYQAMLRKAGRPSLSNQDIKRILKESGGCLTSK